LLQQAAKKTREPVDRVGRLTLLIDELVGHGKPGPEDVNAGVHEINGR
jgi:hypothetical protein